MEMRQFFGGVDFISLKCAVAFILTISATVYFFRRFFSTEVSKTKKTKPKKERSKTKKPDSTVVVKAEVKQCTPETTSSPVKATAPQEETKDFRKSNDAGAWITVNKGKKVAPQRHRQSTLNGPAMSTSANSTTKKENDPESSSNTAATENPHVYQNLNQANLSGVINQPDGEWQEVRFSRKPRKAIRS